MTAFVVVRRNGAEESRHRIHAAVTDGRGHLLHGLGDPDRVTYFRSAAKPFQALPLVEDGVAEAFGLEAGHLAVACGSHSGAAEHVAQVRDFLHRAKSHEEELECGAESPLDPEAARELSASGRKPGRIHHNCSGKHAGMIALARHRGWPVQGYRLQGHPVQVRMQREVARWASVEDTALVLGTDGCGVTTFGLPLQAMARAFGALGRAIREGETGPIALARAMIERPEQVAGRDRLCTLLLEAGKGKILAKVGAEGVYCAAVPDRNVAVALKVEDGSRRAAEPALVRILDLLEVLPSSTGRELQGFRRPAVRNSRQEEVGEIDATFVLEAGEPPEGEAG